MKTIISYQEAKTIFLDLIKKGDKNWIEAKENPQKNKKDFIQELEQDEDLLTNPDCFFYEWLIDNNYYLQEWQDEIEDQRDYERSIKI